MFSRKSFSSKSFSTRSWYMGVLERVVRALRGVSIRIGAQAAVLRTLAAETYTQMRETSVRFTIWPNYDYAVRPEVLCSTVALLPSTVACRAPVQGVYSRSAERGLSVRSYTPTCRSMTRTQGYRTGSLLESVRA